MSEELYRSFRSFFRKENYAPFIGRCLSADQIEQVVKLGPIHPRLAWVLAGPCCLQLHVVTPIGRGKIRDDETKAVYVRLFNDVRGPRVYSNLPDKRLLGRPRIWVEEGLPRDVQEFFFECFRPYVEAFDRVEGTIYYSYKARKPTWSRHLEVRIQISVPGGVWPPKTAEEIEDLWGKIEGLASQFVEMMYGADLSTMLTKTRKGMELLESGEDEDVPYGQILDERGNGQFYQYCAEYVKGWNEVPCAGSEEE